MTNFASPPPPPPPPPAATQREAENRALSIVTAASGIRTNVEWLHFNGYAEAASVFGGGEIYRLLAEAHDLSRAVHLTDNHDTPTPAPA